MAKDKNSAMMLYYTSIDVWEKHLTREQIGTIVLDGYHYETRGEIPDYKRGDPLGIAFEEFKTTLNINQGKYDEKCFNGGWAQIVDRIPERKDYLNKDLLHDDYIEYRKDNNKPKTFYKWYNDVIDAKNDNGMLRYVTDIEKYKEREKKKKP